jgi:tetratricopeptide (TPR) repeat protein
MSLINQMLKDLDKRRGPVNEAHVAALQGMGLVNIHQFKWHNSLPFAAWVATGLLAIIVSYQVSIWWSTRPQTEPALTLQTVAEIAEPERHAQLDTASSQETLEAAPVAAITKITESTEQPLDIPVVPRAEPGQAALQTTAESVRKRVKLLTPEQKADRLFARAQQALSRHQRERGENLLRQALDEYARHVSARSQLAALHLSKQQEDKAERLLVEGLLTDSHQLALARPYAQLLAARNELIPALQTLDRAIGQRRADPETLALRAAILYRMGRHTESATDYQQALQLQPNQALWWTGLAVVLEQSGQSTRALEAYQRAAKLPLDTPVKDYVKQRIQALDNTEFHH